MLLEEKIIENKERFLSLVNEIHRYGMNKETLIKQLTESDFFSAPASTKYHNAYKGGLCEHSLNVYDNLVALNEKFNLNFDEETMKVAGLFHDFSKMNFYTTEIKNKKVYSPTGSKSDSNGRFDWVSYEGYTTKSPDNRLSVAGHEASAAFMTNTFIPLTFEEYAAIGNHHAGMNWDSSKDVWIQAFEKYPLAMYLHIADTMDAFNPEVRNHE